MYCNNCGKANPKGSNYCQFCGIKLQKNSTSRTKLAISDLKDTAEQELLDDKNSPYPYVVSLKKFIILNITTLTLYETYWFYKQWKSLKAQKDFKISPIARAIFSPIFIFSFLGNVAQNLTSVDKTKKLYVVILGMAYILMIVMTGVPDTLVPSLPNWYWLLGMLSFVPLIPAVVAVNHYWDKKTRGNVSVSKFGPSNYIWSVIGIVFWLLVAYGIFGIDEKGNDKWFGSVTSTVSEANAPSDKWATFTEPSERFAIEMPGKPTHQVDNSNPIPYYSYQKDLDGISYGVGFFTFDDREDLLNPKGILDQSISRFLDSNKDTELISSVTTTHKGLPAKDYIVKQNGVITQGRIILAERSQYDAWVSYYENDGKPANYDNFIKSFSIKTK